VRRLVFVGEVFMTLLVFHVERFVPRSVLAA
jgi:hypothetical protein